MEKEIKEMEIYPLPNNRSDFIRIMNKINKIIKVVNKAHTCDCHRCPSEKSSL